MQWSGVRLRDVLEYAGVQSDDEALKHVHLEGLDNNPVTGMIHVYVSDVLFTYPVLPVMYNYIDLLVTFDSNV